MNVPPIDLSHQHQPLLPAMRQAFEQMVATSRFVMGPAVEDFEKALAAYCGTRHAVGMSSGTDALIAALMALNIGPGDEVITTPFTFFATAGSIARVGARPVFVDIHPDSFNIDPSKIEAAVTPRTRAIMPVHLYGQIANVDAISDIARRRNLHIIEDAAQCIGATYRGKMSGAFGDVSCLSFYPTKNLSAMGDAGACLTNDDKLAAALRMIRLHGESKRYHHQIVGANFRIDAFQALMLSIKLPHLEEWTAQRLAVAARYDQLLAKLNVKVPVKMPDRRHVYHQYTIRVPGNRRDALAEHLKSRSIGHGVFYPVPMHLQPCFANLGGKPGDLPNTERAAAEVLSLPIFPGMTPEQQDAVVAAIAEFLQPLAA